MSRALIFGISGFVGKYLAQELQDAGYEVFGSDVVVPADRDMSESNANASTSPNVKKPGFVQADLLDADAVEKCIRDADPDVIINLAAISSVAASWRMPQRTMEVNVNGPLNILEAARKLDKIPRILLVGSSEEYLQSDHPISETFPVNSNNPYGISKMTQESFARLYRERYGMKIFCVRAFNHTGIGQTDSFVLPSFCRQVAQIEKSGNAGIIKVGNLDARRDFSHVKDIVRAYRMILESDDCSKVYNVGSGEAYSLKDLLDFLIGLSSQKIDVVTDPDRFRPVDTPVICCDRSKISRELGWEPKHTVYDALREMFEYYCTKE